MSFGRNLQFLRKLHNKMTQEELADKMLVARQTVSKWELDAVCPEINKVLELCDLFSVTLDNLLRDDLTAFDELYSNFRIQQYDSFKYVVYTVISRDPETDALKRVGNIAKHYGNNAPDIIGWGFPLVSLEQKTVHQMRGYTAAWVVPLGITFVNFCGVMTNPTMKYAAITIKNPMTAPFSVIPNAYKTLMTYIYANGYKPSDGKNVIGCFERSYYKDNIDYMDVFIAIE